MQSPGARRGSRRLRAFTLPLAPEFAMGPGAAILYSASRPKLAVSPGGYVFYSASRPELVLGPGAVCFTPPLAWSSPRVQAAALQYLLSRSSLWAQAATCFTVLSPGACLGSRRLLYTSSRPELATGPSGCVVYSASRPGTRPGSRWLLYSASRPELAVGPGGCVVYSASRLDLAASRVCGIIRQSNDFSRLTSR
ncbi:hypothetical protein NL108_004139 [Boleophthalmus pectinirostris]|nr:hypothetical protein NL108_004139 [Boleophthalmus pectinirostris]